jgi:hypothetical protein
VAFGRRSRSSPRSCSIEHAQAQTLARVADGSRTNQEALTSQRSPYLLSREMKGRCRSKLVAKRQPPSTVLIKRLSPQVSIIELDQNITPPPGLPSLHVPRGLASREGSKAGLILISNHESLSAAISRSFRARSYLRRHTGLQAIPHMRSTGACAIGERYSPPLSPSEQLINQAQ